MSNIHKQNNVKVQPIDSTTETHEAKASVERTRAELSIPDPTGEAAERANAILKGENERSE